MNTTTTSTPSMMQHDMPHFDDPRKAKEHVEFLELVKPGDATHVAIKNGSWFDPSTWQNGRVPGNDAQVLIGDGVRVLYDQESDARIKTVRVDGTLNFASGRDTKLVVDTFVNAPEGTLNIGTEANPIRADKTAKIIIADNGRIDRQWDPTLISRGLLSHGKVNIYGADKTDFVSLRQDVTAGSDQLVLSRIPAGWKVGDRLVVGGTNNRYNGSHADNSKFEDEVLTITSINGNRVRFTNNDIKTGDNTVLRFDHTRPDVPEKDQLKLYVANTSRNVTVASENGANTPIQNRGHVMFMHNPDVRVNNAEFYELGRTDKSKVIDNPGKNMDGSNGRGTNTAGRYSLHFHRTGADDINGQMAIAKGNSVVGSPGWGIVHHDSHALLEDNVVFDVVGSSIVAESGNELGAWRNNLTIKTTGVPWNNILSTQKTRERKFDHGFRGEGYWIQGAAQVAMKDNIAISTNDAGLTIFGDTLRTSDARDAETIAVKNLPRALQSKVAVPGQEEVDITDIPLRQFTGFEGYNNRDGIRVWGHMTNVDGHLEFDSPDVTTAHDERSLIDDFKIWNSNWSGLNVQYSSNIDIQNGLILGDLEKPSLGEGIFNNHASFKNAYDNITVRGFEEGLKFTFSNEDKEFLDSRVQNSTFSDNIYNFSKIGDRKFNSHPDQPDDNPAFLELENVNFETKAGNAAPVARFGMQNAGGYGRWFDAGDSFDQDSLKPDGRTLAGNLTSKGISAYGWDFNNDGRLDQFGRRVNHVFNRAGSHDVSLTVWDSQGATKTLQKTVNIQPTAYPNAFQDYNFSNINKFVDNWKSTSEWAEESWYAAPSVKLENGAARISQVGQYGGRIGQIIENDGIHRGRQTLSLDLQNLEGGDRYWRHNEIEINLWGINGPFASDITNTDGPETVGTLPMSSRQLLNYSIQSDDKDDKNDTAFDWKTMKWDVNLGEGYQYLLFQVNTGITGDRGDRVAIDNVRLTGKPDAAGPASSNSALPPNPPTSNPPTSNPPTSNPNPVRPPSNAGSPNTPMNGNGDGLTATYFNNQNLTNPGLNRIDPTIDFQWKKGSPDQAIDPNTFSARWTGKIQPRYSETYKFSSFSDNGMRVWIDGENVINHWVRSAPKETAGSIDLEAGKKYDIKVEYFEAKGGAAAELSWSSASQTKEIVPQSQLYSYAPRTASGTKAATATAPGFPLEFSSSALDLSNLQSYDSENQDKGAQVTVSQQGSAASIQGNGWKSLPINYKITPDTQLSMEFRSGKEGEIHAIGFDTNNKLDGGEAKRSFKLTGTQKWGMANFDDYVTQSGWKSYTIPVGEYLTGKMFNLLLINDHDVRNPDATSEFRNIELFETSDGIGDSNSDMLTASNGLPDANALLVDTATSY